MAKNYPAPAWRQQLDRYLESQGLLNYQTRGMTADQIAERYRRAGVSVRPDWFAKNYGAQMPGHQGYDQGQGQAQDKIIAPPPPTKPVDVYSTDNAPGQGVPYNAALAPNYTTAENGLTVRAKFATADMVKAGQGNWTDVFVDERKKLLSDPTFYQQNKILEYSPAAQQQILADPAFDWKQLADWQKPFYQVSSNPKIMASPMAIAGAHAGSGLGIVGRAVGAVAGYSLGVIGGQQFNPAGNLQQQPTAAAKAMYLLNELAQVTEQAAGYYPTVLGMKLAASDKNQNAEWLADPKNRQALWEASRTTWDYSIGGEMQNALPGIESVWEIMKNPSKASAVIESIKINGKLPDNWLYVVGQTLDHKLTFAEPGQGFTLGANAPMQIGDTTKNILGGQSLDTAKLLIQDAKYIRSEIEKGRDPNDVANEVLMKGQSTVGGQIGDFAGQAKFDPLELVGEAQSLVGRGLSEATGNKVAAAAFTDTEGIQQAASKYRSLVQSGAAQVIQPDFKVNEMGWLGRQVAGITPEGKIKASPFSSKGLLDPTPPKNFIEEMTTLQPGARASIGASMFYENMGAFLSMFDDPKEAAGYLQRVAGGDNAVWAELSSTLGNSPEWYTILPALKAFDTEKLGARLAEWDAATPNREALLRMADILGEEPSKLLDDWAKRGTTEQDLSRIVDRASRSTNAEAKAFLEDAKAGRITPDTLKQIVDIFHGDNPLPWHPAQWKASVFSDLSEHFDNWAAQSLKLAPESTFYRTAHLLKSAQSILLLGGNPGYAITNGLSNMVHRAATGIYGYLSPNQIKGWVEKFGITPARLHEGFGMAGEFINQAAEKTPVAETAIRAAQTETKGIVAATQRFLSNVSNKLPFTKLSSMFEKVEGEQGYVIAMRQFWGQSWRRGVGFSEMPAALRRELTAAGMDPDIMHSAIEAGMNQAEIEKAIYGKTQAVQARALVHEAAQRSGMTASEAAVLLEKIGVLDNLDQNLARANTRDKLYQAFRRAKREAHEQMDIQAAADMVARAELISQRLTTEGAKAFTDIITDIEMQGVEKWMQHYERMGAVAESMDAMESGPRAKTWEMAYEESTGEYRRYNAYRAATYMGILKAVGLGENESTRKWLAVMGDTDQTMDNAYRYMSEQRKAHFDKWREDWGNPNQYDERSTIEARIDKKFKSAMKREADNLTRMTDLLGKQYESLFGVEAGEAARQAYEQIGAFRKEMVDRQQKFRDDQAKAREMGVPLEDRKLAAKKFWGETYKYMIVEMARIKQDAIARLDRIVKSGGEEAPAPSPATEPTPPPAEPVANVANVANEPPPAPVQQYARPAQNAVDIETDRAKLIADAEARKVKEGDRINTILDIAEENGYRRGTTDIKYGFLGALRKYGELENLESINDPRLTPEFVRDTMAIRKAAKENVGVEKMAKLKAKIKDPNNISLLVYIRAAGGLDVAKLSEYAKDKNAKYMPGLFQRKGFSTGWDITDMARRLSEEGKYGIDLNKPGDEGGVKQLQDMLDRALKGEKIYPTGHDYEADIKKAEAVNAEAQVAEQPVPVEPAPTPEDVTLAAEPVTPEPVFSANEWYARLVAATDEEKLTVIGELPDNADQNLKDFASQQWDEVIARITKTTEQEAIAENLTRSEMAIDDQQQRADIAMTRQILAEKYADAFPNVGKDQINDWMEISDAALEAIGKLIGETKEQMYERYKDVIRGDEGNLLQIDTRLQPVNRSMSDAEMEGYARALVRAGADELRRAIQNEPNKADRIALLDKAHELNPQMAEDVARRVRNMLYQSAKGGVSFVDGKAIIHAWEGGDISTIVHENAHIYLDMMQDAAKRTGNVGLLDDLGVFRDWARLEQTGDTWKAANSTHFIKAFSDGTFSYTGTGEPRFFDTFEEAKYTLEQEMFARGFERYLIEGKAPTKALARVFKNFKRWLRNIYMMITGSQIDVNLTPEMASFFDKMLGGEAKVEYRSGEVVNVGDTVSFTAKGRTRRGVVTEIPNDVRVNIDTDQGKYTVAPDKLVVDKAVEAKPKPIEMFPAGEDLPMFSGTAQTVTPDVFAPAPEIKQESMFDTRPEFGQKYEENLIKVKDGLKPEEAKPAEPINAGRERNLLNALSEKISAKDWFAKSRDFESFIKNLGFNLDDEKDLNLAYDIMEGAYNLQARRIRADLNARSAGTQERIEAMDVLESNLTEARRTLGKMKLQQFSTPLTISEAAGIVADVRPGDTVGEPTAGTANLVDRFFETDGVTVKVNELEAGRRQVLSLIGYDPTGLNLMATEWSIQDGKKAPPFAEVVITNPPWGSYGTGKYGTPVNVPVKMNDWSQRFTYLTLLRMPEDGRLVGVMPANWLYTVDRRTRAITNKPSEFYKWLKKNYSVRAVIESLPGAYKQRGTDVSSLLVVVDKTSHALDVDTIEAYGANQPKTLGEYVKYIESVPKRTQEAVTHAQEQLKPIVAGPDASGLVDPAARLGTESRPENIGKPSESKPARVRPISTNPVQPEGITQPVGGIIQGQPVTGNDSVRSQPLDGGRDAGGADGNVGQPQGSGRDNSAGLVAEVPERVSKSVQPFNYSNAFKERLATAREKIKASRIYTEYVARSPLRPDELAHPHPTVIVETKALAGVPYPALEEAYRPTPSVMRAMENRMLSHDGNIDPIWAAIQQNDKHNMGILVSDDVGMGKSRTAAGFVMDRIERGHKRILVVTMNEQNVINLMDEFPRVYSGVADETGFHEGAAPKDFPAKLIYLEGDKYPEVKKGEQPIPSFGDSPVVLFVNSYQFKDFAGALKNWHAETAVVDEAHRFLNAENNESGPAWSGLHEDWIRNKSSIMYLTATPGKDISELKYLYGLKVWSMDGFNDWVGIITGQEDPATVRAKAQARKGIEEWSANMNAERIKIGATETEVIRKNGESAAGYRIGQVEAYSVEVDKNHKAYGLKINDKNYDANVESITELIIVADLVNKNITGQDISTLMPSDVRRIIVDANMELENKFPKPDTRVLGSGIDMSSAADSAANGTKPKWGRKGLGAWDTTVPPAHTEQIMRELKVSGSYMSRDITRDGLEFDIKQYTPTAAEKKAHNARVKIYRKMVEAFYQFGAFNEGPKAFGAKMGLNGPIQADAKRSLFNMRLPGIINETDAAIARGEKVVINLLAVKEVKAEEGNLAYGISLINDHAVEDLGDGLYSEPTKIPEALVAKMELTEALKELPTLPSPEQALTNVYGKRILFVSGEVSVKKRIYAAKAFQDNKIDVIVISGAGKTGINLHDINGKRRVHMIYADYDWAAADVKQGMGRIDRTGQKTSPMMTLMHTGSGAEQKFIATMANRLTGIGAVGKGGADSVGTEGLDTYELGTQLDREALSSYWSHMPDSMKSNFLDKFFKDPTVPGAFRSDLEPTAASLNKFLLAMQSLEIDEANSIMEGYLAERQKFIDENSAVGLTEAQAVKSAKQTGDINRTVDLSDNLRMTEVVSGKQRYAIIDGVLTPHMAQLKAILLEGRDSINSLVSGSNDSGWMRWVQFYDEKSGRNISGLQIIPKYIEAVATHFGQAMTNQHTPDNALIAMHAGERVRVIGSGMAKWELYFGKGGDRKDKIIIDKAKIADRDALMKNGALFHRTGFFYITEDQLPDFFKRFPIQNDAPEVKPTLYQSVLPNADPRMPLGAMEQAAGVMPEGQANQDMWSEHVDPLLDNMRDVAIERLGRGTPEGASRDLSPEGQAMLRKYMQETKASMATSKLATIRYGENQRDFALLNYKRRYGFDKALETIYPYQFYYTRTMLNWALRALDKPAWFSNYARIQRQTNRYERDIPERLRGKIKVDAPWMPDWLGDALYIDPMKIIFPFTNFSRPFDTIMRDNNYQTIEAERILQEWSADGKYSDSQITQAAKTRSGATWERALAEAKLRREGEINNPMDFLNSMFGPAWYLTTPYNLLLGDKNKVSPTPMLNTARAIGSVTKGTWAEPVGQAISLLGKPEEMLRSKLGLPELGEYGDYYIDRQLANMTAEGIITSEQAQIAMTERSGQYFDMARERVKTELAMRVPTMSALLAGLTADNFGQGVARAAQTLPASMFGSGLLPAGELEYRGLKQEWNEAWKRRDMGDTKALTRFFDEHPEYEAYLAKGKEPEARLRTFLIGQIWDGYMALETTDRKQASAELGDLFKQSFLDTETRSYDTLDVETLTKWARMLNKNVPNTPQTAPAIETPPIQKFDPAITRVTDQFFTDRSASFPNYYSEQQGYYAIPESDKSGRRAYLAKHPQLKAYWDWKKKYYDTYPELVPIFNGGLFQRVDTTGWSPILIDYIGMYAMAGTPLPTGAMKALTQEWLAAGRPMDNVQTWLDVAVVPAMMYNP